jgi:hypothetical protein
MYVMPIVFLPYTIFSMWIDFVFGASTPTHRARDPLADRGTGSTSQAALNSHEPHAGTVPAFVSNPGVQPLV